MSDIEKQIKTLLNKRQKYIDAQLKFMDAGVADLQKKLLTLIYEDYVQRFQRDAAGTLVMNEKNIRIANELEKVFDRFNTAYHETFVKEFGNRLLSTTTMTAQYYKGVGVAASTVDNLLEKLSFLNKSIGIEVGKTIKDSKIIKGSYLDKLTKSDEVRTQLKSYVMNSVGGKKDMQGFISGFKDLVTGSDQVDGRLQRYYRQYAYDSFNEVQSTADLYFADNLKLNYFIYQGALMEKSRPFCRKHAGKVYSRQDAKKFDSDEWEGKKPDVPFLIQRGGFNCRHEINWISDEMAKDLGYAV